METIQKRNTEYTRDLLKKEKKEMKLTYLQVNNLYEFMNMLIQNNVSVPMKTGFKLLYNLQQLNPLYLMAQQKYNNVINSIDEDTEDKNKKIDEELDKIKDDEVPAEFNGMFFNPKEFDGYRFSIEQINVMIPLLKVGQNEEI